jgi:hypothetical protein
MSSMGKKLTSISGLLDGVVNFLYRYFLDGKN